ncbi:hypothetical protein AC26_1575 [Escherichia coli 1-176-05_S3_C2]|nr:hypothetical protein AC26_1575 [Escherichia coli 1-176-05_S3_C2]
MPLGFCRNDTDLLHEVQASNVFLRGIAAITNQNGSACKTVDK